jgi:membrane peptidoglycan carboxypeptidase
MDGWRQGKFSTPETFDEAVEAFFTPDVVFDVWCANETASTPDQTVYSLDNLKSWFDNVACFDLTDVVVSALPSTQDPSQVWQQFNCIATNKATGKRTRIESLKVVTFQGAKVKRVAIMYGAARLHQCESAADADLRVA